VWVQSLTLSHFWESDYDSWVALSTHTFPCPCFGHKPRAKVVTLEVQKAKVQAISQMPQSTNVNQL